MVPTDVDRVLDAPLPVCCPDCGGDVVEERIADQYQLDLPTEPQARTTRFRVSIGRCVSCRRRVQGRHPEQASDALGAAGSVVGPGAKAWAHWLHYGLGLSFAKCSTLLGRLGVNVTAGALCQAAQSTGTDLLPVHQEILRRVNAAPVLVMDETGWRVGGNGVWLWVATVAEATAYVVAPGRGFAQATLLVAEDYSGTLVRDGWAPYRSYEAADHQTCLAHYVEPRVMWRRPRSAGGLACQAGLRGPVAPHNHRASRKARSGSGGRKRPGVVFGGVVRASARSLMARWAAT